jgi:hypothetical protein
VYSTADLRLEAQSALERVWFVQSLEETERTDLTLSLRFYIRPSLFVQAFLGQCSGSLYLALIEGERRIFGIDREAGGCHTGRPARLGRRQPLRAGTDLRAAAAVSRRAAV